MTGRVVSAGRIRSGRIGDLGDYFDIFLVMDREDVEGLGALT